MSIKKAIKKSLPVSFVQLTSDSLDEVLSFINTLPRRAIWNHPTGGFSEWDNYTEGDTIGVLVFSGDGTMRGIATVGSYVIKDQEGDYLFMTEDQFKSQYDVVPEVSMTPTPTAPVAEVTANTNSTTTTNTNKTTKGKPKS